MQPWKSFALKLCKWVGIENENNKIILVKGNERRKAWPTCSLEMVSFRFVCKIYREKGNERDNVKRIDRDVDPVCTLLPPKSTRMPKFLRGFCAVKQTNTVWLDYGGRTLGIWNLLSTKGVIPNFYLYIYRRKMDSQIVVDTPFPAGWDESRIGSKSHLNKVQIGSANLHAHKHLSKMDAW